MWKIFTSLGDISKLLDTIIKGVTTLLQAWARKREIGKVEKTTQDIKDTVDKANKIGDVTEINKKFGF